MLQQEQNQASENISPNLQNLLPPAVRRQMTSRYWLTQLIYTAKLGIADLFKSGSLSYLEIAS
jgi:hypothetical protein